MIHRTNILILGAFSATLLLSGCKNSDLGLPDLKVTWTVDNLTDDVVYLTIDSDQPIYSNQWLSIEPTIYPGVSTGDTLTYSNVLAGMNTVTVNVDVSSYASCTVVTQYVPLSSYADPDIWQGDIGGYNPPVSLNYNIICGYGGLLQLKAQHTQDPVLVSLKAQQQQQRFGMKALPPINLLPSNHFTNKQKLDKKQQYTVNVNPMVDSQDRVAHFAQQVQSADKKLVVDYELSPAHLIASPILDAEGMASLPAIVQQGYNTIVWHGVTLRDHALQLTSDSQIGFDDAWQQVQAQLQPKAFIQSLLAIDHADQLSAQQYRELPGLLPKGLHKVQLNLSSVPASLVQAVQQWHQQQPSLQVVLNVTHALNDADRVRLKSLLSILTQTDASDQAVWQGWVQVPLSQIQTMKSVVSAPYLVAAMPAKLSTQTDQQYLSCYPKADVIGMSLPLNQVDDTSAVKSTVFLPAAD